MNEEFNENINPIKDNSDSEMTQVPIVEQTSAPENQSPPVYSPPMYNQPQQYRPPYNPYTSPVAPPTPSKPKKEKKKHQIGTVPLIILVVVCSLIAGAFGASLSRGSKSSNNGTITEINKGNREPVKIEINEVDTSKVHTAAEVYAQNVQSTVGITTTITVNYWGYRTNQAAAGSGFIITADGYILTNYHVIEDSNKVTVTMFDDTEYEAKVIGYDESNDIAIIKIEAEGLTPVVLGNSDEINVGDDVVAIGNPLGELTFSLTKGVVSAIDRDVTFSDGVTMKLIQTDCSINSGNSGGALFNMYGEVIGITNAKYSGSSSEASVDNIGFAIPISKVYSIVESIIEKGYISKPYIGVSVLTVDENSTSYGIPAGAGVKEVTKDGPADKAGLMVNDFITAVIGEEISKSDELVAIVAESKVGDELEFSIYRSGEEMILTIEVEEKIISANAADDNQSDESGNYGDEGYQGGYNGGYPFNFEDFFGQFFG